MSDIRIGDLYACDMYSHKKYFYIKQVNDDETYVIQYTHENASSKKKHALSARAFSDDIYLGNIDTQPLLRLVLNL